MAKHIIITIAIDTEAQSVQFLSTDIEVKDIPAALNVLRNFEDNLIGQLTGGVNEPAEG